MRWLIVPEASIIESSMAPTVSSNGEPERRNVASTSYSHASSPWVANTRASSAASIRSRREMRPITAIPETSTSGRSAAHCSRIRSTASRSCSVPTRRR